MKRRHLIEIRAPEDRNYRYKVAFINTVADVGMVFEMDDKKNEKMTAKPTSFGRLQKGCDSVTTLKMRFALFFLLIY